MTAVDSSEAARKATNKARRRNVKKKREKKKIKTKVRLARRLETYKKILETAKAARSNTARFRFDVRVPKRVLDVSSRVIPTSNTAVQLTSSPYQINPQLAMSGNCFWLNYQSVFHWKDRHMSNLSIDSFPQTSPRRAAPPPRFQTYQNNQKPRRYGVDVPLEDPHIAGYTPQSEYYSYEAEYPLTGGVNGEENEEVEGSDDDIVVTEEMMQFLEISMRHKAKREREKQAAKELARKKLIEDKDTSEDCRVPTEEDENEKRLREMFELYGKEAAKIHGMETALQLNFNRQLDLFNPSYWPFYPFSMRFTGVTAVK